MNKTSLKALAFIGAAACSMMLGGCSLGDDELTTYFSISLNNLIIPADPDAAPIVQKGCSYKVNYDLAKGLATVSTADLKISGDAASFTTDEMKMTQRMAQGNYYIREFSGAGHMDDGSYDIVNFKGVETQLFYATPTLIPGISNVTMDAGVVFTYGIGDKYRVKTFMSDMNFKGETVTTFSMKGQTINYVNNDPVYRIKFSDDLKKATLVIYNVRFAEQMPKPLAAVIVKDLDVTFTRQGYVISGSERVPEVLEGGATTEYPNYTFNSFKFTADSDDLTKAVCEYTVAGRFKGVFKGNYLAY